MTGALDQGAYLARIGVTGALCPDLATLRRVHLAHATHIPFENLDVQWGVPIRLDLKALEDKLVRRRRGGYCFEQNTLLLAVLRQAGFDARPCEARVRLGTGQVTARTHMLLVVRLDGAELLADVGFGGQGLLEPVPMDGRVHEQFGDAYRVIEQGAERVVQWREGDLWSDLYAYVPEARHPIDFELANHYTSTHPDSRFVRTVTVQLPTPEARHVLRNLTYTRRSGPDVVERKLALSELAGFIREQFGLEVPAGARFHALDAPAPGPGDP